jgi:hypothetical protein
MFKHNIEYNDFNGNPRKEDFYFHLSKPEVLRIEAEIGNDIKSYTEELVATQNLKDMLSFLEKMLLNSYGKKTTDGKSFVKNKELREEFEYSNAYAELFEQLLTNGDLARKFGESVADKGASKKNTVSPSVVSE